MRLLSLAVLLACSPTVSAGQSAPATVADSRATGSRGLESRTTHLLEAARHLEAAGLHDHAKAMRDLAEKERGLRDELQRKIVQRDALTQEIQRLQRQIGVPQQIVVHATICELSLTGLQEGKHELDGVDNNVLQSRGLAGLLAEGAFDAAGTQAEIEESEHSAGTVGIHVLEKDGRLLSAMEALRKAGVLKVLADPVLVTTSGRPARFREGGEFPILTPQPSGQPIVEYIQFGTQLDCLPVLLGDGKMRLEVRPRLAELDAARNTIVDGTVIPGLRVREMDTAAEMIVGDTLVLAGLTQFRQSSPTWQSEESPDGANGQDVPLRAEAKPTDRGTAGTDSAEEVELVFVIRTELIGDD